MIVAQAKKVRRELEKIGIIINPKAGNGVGDDVVRGVVERLSPKEVYGGAGRLGGFLRDSGINFIEIDLKPKGDAEDTIRLVEIFNGLDLDVVVVFGGDGTMSDASVSRHALLCIPTGTTNVSPLIFNDSTTFSLEEIKLEKFVEVEMDGLVLKVNDHSFNAFNDIVVGSTILSTVNGKKTQIDAELYLKGKKVESKPRKFKARVEITKGKKILKAIEGTFGNIFISLTGERYLGKGIAGGAAISTFTGFRAVVACTNEGMIYRYSKEELRKVEPFITTSLSFDEGEVVNIHSNEIISRDGTPIGRADCVQVECRRGLTRVLKLSKSRF